MADFSALRVALSRSKLTPIVACLVPDFAPVPDFEVELQAASARDATATTTAQRATGYRFI